MTTRTLSLNAYYDFPLQGTRFTPYLGAGAGVSFVELSDLIFLGHYRCRDFTAPDCTGLRGLPDITTYDSVQHEDITDAVFSAHFHAGLDYRLNKRVLLGLKLTYSMVDDMEARGSYIRHPVPNLANFTKISGMDHWSLVLGVKFFFGD